MGFHSLWAILCCYLLLLLLSLCKSLLCPYWVKTPTLTSIIILNFLTPKEISRLLDFTFTVVDKANA